MSLSDLGSYAPSEYEVIEEDGSLLVKFKYVGWVKVGSISENEEGDYEELWDFTDGTYHLEDIGGPMSFYNKNRHEEGYTIELSLQDYKQEMQESINSWIAENTVDIDEILPGDVSRPDTPSPEM